MKNNKNKSQEHLNPAIFRIAEILELTKDQIDDLKIKQEQKGVQKVIYDLLKGNEDKILSDKKTVILLLTHYNKDITNVLDRKFQNDKQIAILSVKKDYKNFFRLEEKLKQNTSLGKTALESMVRSSVHINEAIFFIDQFFKDEKINEELRNHYFKKLKLANKIYNDDLSKGFILIMKNNSDFYNLLKDRKVLDISNQCVKLNKKFEKEFLDLLGKQDDLRLLEGEELNRKTKEFLAKYFNISINSLDEDDLFVFDTIFNFLNISNNLDKSKKLKNSKKDDEKNIEIELNLKKKQKEEIEPEEKLDFSLPGYEYKETSNGYYSISTGNHREINISEKELYNFTTTGLKNFIKFYEMLEDLNLNFLWDENKSSFINILNNKIGFNYPDGQGVTESRATRVLNLIGRAIGLIGKDKDCEYEKNFETLPGAKLAFSEVKSNGKIAGDIYKVDSMIGDSPVKSALKFRGYMSEKNELNFSKF